MAAARGPRRSSGQAIGSKTSAPSYTRQFPPQHPRPGFECSRSEYAALARTISRTSTSTCRADRLIVITGLSGSGQVLARLRHALRGRPAALRREPVCVCPPVPVDDGQARRRLHRGPVAGHRHRAEGDVHNPRSTVGTVTEIYDYLRLLYARAGMPRCPDHGIDLDAQTVSQMVDQVLKLPRRHGGRAAGAAHHRPQGRARRSARGARRPGLRRARIDGEAATRWSALPKLDPKRKHTIEAVVDRFRGEARRCASASRESFETALRVSEGLARLIFLDDPSREEIVFSSRHACPVCGYSVPALEPKLFSFNSPSGACPTCDGLGVKEFFDPARVVTNPDLSLAGGAIRGWDRRNAYYFQLIQSLAKHYDFDIETPWNELPAKVQKVVLYGSGDQVIEFRYTEGKGKTTQKKHVFEGILPNLERRYRETESTHGARGAREVPRHAAVPGLQGHAPQPRGALTCSSPIAPLPDVAHLTVGRALEFFRGLNLAGWRGEVATKIVKDVGRPPALPRRRGPRLPHAGPQRRVALGRRSAAHPAREPGGLGPHRRDVHPRRALDRPAPARQPAAARDAQTPARHRQHGDRRRARRGRRSSRPITSSTWGPAPACTAARSSRRARRRRSRRARHRSPAST